MLHSYDYQCDFVNQAVEREALDAVRALLDCGLQSPDAVLRCRTVRSLDLLLERGVDVNILPQVLDRAAAARRREIVERLMSLGVQVSYNALRHMRSNADAFGSLLFARYRLILQARMTVCLVLREIQLYQLGPVRVAIFQFLNLDEE